MTDCEQCASPLFCSKLRNYIAAAASYLCCVSQCAAVCTTFTLHCSIALLLLERLIWFVCVSHKAA